MWLFNAEIVEVPREMDQAWRVVSGPQSTPCSKGKGGMGDIDPHDKLAVDGKAVRLSEPIFHYVYRSIGDQVATINSFSDIYAKGHGPASNLFVLAGAVHIFAKFLECYLWKFGFLDGLPGFIIAVNSAWYVFLKHAKAWELRIKERE